MIAIRPTIIVGLGNPGSEYKSTRHNIGFEVIDAFSESESSAKWQRKKEKKYLYCRLKDNAVILVKPATYMNLSGEAVQSVLDELGAVPNLFRRPVSEILVICDDFSLPLGKIRFRYSGSSGGHNGLKSIIAFIGDEFPRLKIGVGPLPNDIDPADYVLGKFSESEKPIKRRVISESVKIINDFLSSGYAGVETWDISKME